MIQTVDVDVAADGRKAVFALGEALCSTAASPFAGELGSRSFQAPEALYGPFELE